MEQFLGRYEILSELGQGGMGAVYLARHTLLGKTVALKTLLPQLAKNPDYVARFMREARAAANLNHPHIVQVFDVDQAGGQHFFAMERIEGETLQRRIRTHGPLSAAESLRIARQITDALAFAHARGIVHRDLKPANIMLDSHGQVKVMDFGIAAAADSESLTLTGQLLGTPKYMAPEQARGEEVDGRSDLFSLGMTMCEMLAGRTPLDGKDIVSTVGALLQTDQPLILDLPPTVPDDLAAIVVRLTQKRREARYPNAPALAADLARAAGESGAGDSGTVVTPLTTTVTAEQLAAKRRYLWAPIAAAIILLAAALGLWRWQAGQERPASLPSARDTMSSGTAAPPLTTVPDTTTLAAPPPTPPAQRAPVDRPTTTTERPASEHPARKEPPPTSAPRAPATATPPPPSTEESPAEVNPPPAPATAPENAGERAPDRESVLAALEPRRRELADARAAAEEDSAQATTSYHTARGYEDSLLGYVAAADAGGANRSADRALVFYGRAREERAAILAQRSAAAERARAVAEPSHQRSGVARGDSQRRSAETALASGDFTGARAGFEAARDAYERAGRKSR
jgi:serine/threonine-protein kinase